MTIYNNFPANFIAARRVLEQFNAVQDKLTNANKFPLYDIEKLGTYSFEVRLALAGFAKEELTVTYEDSILTIKGNKEPKEERKDSVILHKGISFGQFERSFVLDENSVIDSVKYVDGILTISFHIAIPEKQSIKTLEIK